MTLAILADTLPSVTGMGVARTAPCVLLAPPQPERLLAFSSGEALKNEGASPTR